jgi:hypothetical protein
VALATAYITRSKAAEAKIDKGTPPVTREALYVEAFQNASRAVLVDPQNGDALGRKEALRGELAGLFKKHAEAANALIEAKRFEEARPEVAALTDLNRKLGGQLDPEVREAGYALNYRWAASLFSQKDYSRAEARVDAALSASRTAEASALKRRISDIRGQADQEASFDAGLQEIDRLIGKQDLVGAKKRIESLARATKDSAKLDTLDDRRDKVRSYLKDIYDKGVAAYRDENFKDAIDSLQTVVLVDVNYEQASDYLDKARAKQKLLDKY